MMKGILLLCNAHIDPIWQWEWEEGASAAISTFRSAADLLKKHDYVFNHNEVTLYKYVEEYAPALFEEIKTLIKEGKWRIMGGWYLQPDCNMPCGESIVRQIQKGKKYFTEKFGVYSKTVTNFDPFGHNIGLVQIIKKCGQDSYIFQRPEKENLTLPCDQFIWKGLDGSEIKAIRISHFYGSRLGKAVEDIERKLETQIDFEYGVALWGVGNHGGGPSDQDLTDIENWSRNSKIPVKHSHTEEIFSLVKPVAVYDRSLQPSMPGCYSSNVGYKQKHIELENALYFTELLASVAAMNTDMEYPQDEFDEVVEDLCNCEFHDTLPGTCIKKGEEQGYRWMYHGLSVLNKIRARAYFALTMHRPIAEKGEYPFYVFNPHPYSYRTNVELDFSLVDSNWDKTVTTMRFACNGETLTNQQIKEESNLNLDWRKKFLVNVELPPMSVIRISAYETGKISNEVAKPQQQFQFDYAGRYFEIDEKTGLPVHFIVNGKEYIQEGAFQPFFYEDDADPWGMASWQLEGMGREPKAFALSNGGGVFQTLKSVKVIEDGEILTAVESLFECENTKIALIFLVYKNSIDVDVKVKVFASDVDRLLKLRIPLAMKGEYIGQCSYGTEHLAIDGSECVAQRFVAVKDADTCFAVLNKSIYASSYVDGVISLTLLRTAAYCAHPIDEAEFLPKKVWRPLIPEDRLVDRMDQGLHEYSFRLTVCEESELERKAMEFNRVPYAVSVFPIGGESVAKKAFGVTLSNPNIVLEAFKKGEMTDGYILRLLNNSSATAETIVEVGESVISLMFGKYEVKTLLYSDTLKEVYEMMI